MKYTDGALALFPILIQLLITLFLPTAATASDLWPSGTTANASSVHDPNFALQCQCNRTYDAINAIDNNPDTFWNDNTQAAYPDQLYITPPTPVDLSGFIVVSSIDGFISTYSISVYVGGSWKSVGGFNGISSLNSTINFTAGIAGAESDGRITGIESVVVIVQATQNDDFARINELYPIYATTAETSSTSSSASATRTVVAASSTTSSSASATGTVVAASSTTSSSPSAAPPQSGTPASKTNAGPIAGGVVGGVGAVALLALGAFYIRRKKRANPTESATINNKTRDSEAEVVEVSAIPEPCELPAEYYPLVEKKGYAVQEVPGSVPSLGR